MVPFLQFDVVVFMIKKLFALVQDKCVPEGVDAVMMHEVVLGGHLYLQVRHRIILCSIPGTVQTLFNLFSVHLQGDPSVKISR